MTLNAVDKEWAIYREWRYRLQATGTYKGQWYLYVFDPMGNAWGDMISRLIREPSMFVNGRTRRIAARRARRTIRQLERQVQRSALAYP